MEFTTEENGVKVVINPASLQDAFKLKSVIQKSLLDNKVNLDEAVNSDSGIVEAIMALDSSEAVFESMFECLKKSTYGGVKITKDTFESEQARYDLYEVFFYCLKVNIYPFFKSLLSKFGMSFEKHPKGEGLSLK